MSDIVLTEAQDKLMVDTWNKSPNNPPEIKELAKIIFDKDCDIRSPEVIAIKKALTTHNLKSKSLNTKVSQIELSVAHKQYITNNAQTMNGLEMARIIFSNPALTALHAETRAVNEFIRTLSNEIFDEDTLDNTVIKDYSSPTSIEATVKRVNLYIANSIDRSKITPKQKKFIETLIGYLGTYRFIAQMNSYETESDRKLCEDAFIRYTYDKPDLTQEEIDQYIELSNQVVQGFKIQRRSERLQNALEEISSGENQDMKISMGLVEAIGKASTEYHQCIQRQEKLFAMLTQKRSARMDKMVHDNASVLNLIEIWKTEEGRTELLKHAAREQAAVADEVEKLSTLAEIKARIFGLVKDEIKNG